MAEAASIRAGTPARRRRSRGFSQRRLAFFMVSPAMIVIAIVAAYPILYAIWLSLHQYSLIHAGLSRWASPAGLGNYKDALQDPDFWNAVRVTFEFTIASVFL